MHLSGVKSGPPAMRADAAGQADSAAAFLAAATLERYELDLREVVQQRPDPGAWERLVNDVRALRRCFAALPGLCVPWLDLLLSHSRLLATLAQREGAKLLASHYGNHLRKLDTLAHRCRGLCIPAH